MSEFVFVLLGLAMPKMGGDECLLELRRINKDAVIIMTSGYDEHDVAEQRWRQAAH